MTTIETDEVLVEAAGVSTVDDDAEEDAESRLCPLSNAFLLSETVRIAFGREPDRATGNGGIFGGGFGSLVVAIEEDSFGDEMLLPSTLGFP